MSKNILFNQINRFFLNNKRSNFVFSFRQCWTFTFWLNGLWNLHNDGPSSYKFSETINEHARMHELVIEDDHNICHYEAEQIH